MATITLNRPDRLNAYTQAMAGELREAFAAADADEGVRAIVLTGAGRGFCAGADMERLSSAVAGADRPQAQRQLSDRGPGGQLRPELQLYPGPQEADHRRDQNGPCAGIGLVFACFCDLRFASAQAVADQLIREARPDRRARHLRRLLPRLIGPARARSTCCSSARTLTGAEAEQLGLVNKSFPAERFADDVTAYARQLVDSVSPPRSPGRLIEVQVWKTLFQRLRPSAETTADHEDDPELRVRGLPRRRGPLHGKARAEFSGPVNR